MSANGKRNKHISVRFDDELAQRLVKAAKQQLEGRSVSDFIRNLIEWAILHYEQNGTIAELHGDGMERHPRNGKTRHISIHSEELLAQRLVKAAKQQERRSVSDFVRRLLEWAMVHYERHGTITELYRDLPAPSPRTKA